MEKKSGKMKEEIKGNEEEEKIEEETEKKWRRRK